jgi:hypothetical protein
MLHKYIKGALKKKTNLDDVMLHKYIKGALKKKTNLDDVMLHKYIHFLCYVLRRLLGVTRTFWETIYNLSLFSGKLGFEREVLEFDGCDCV